MHRRAFIKLVALVFLLGIVGCQTATPVLDVQETPEPEVVPETATSVETVIAPTSTPFVMTDPYPPSLLDFRPRPGEEVSTTTAIQLDFDQPMDKDSVTQSFRLSPDVEGTFIWKGASSLRYRPDHLVPETRYEVSLDGGAKSQDGLPLGNDYDFSFSTIAPLIVTQVSPQDGATDLRGDAEILLAFNRPIVPMNCIGDVAQAGSGCTELPMKVSPSVLGRGEWVNTSLYRFTPISGWGAGQRYDVTLPASVSGAMGAALGEAFGWSFQTAPPRVEAVFPEPGTEQVRLESSIRVTFNTPMDQTITGREFTLVSDDERAIPGAIRWQDNGAELIFTPAERLALDSVYRVQVSPRARARTSAPLENPTTWSFRTVSGPRLVRTTPDDGATSVGVNQPVQLSFEGAIDSETLVENVAIQPVPDTSHFFTHFDENSRVFTLRWDRQPRTEYCVEVLSGVGDIYGHTLEESENFCFVTGDLPSRLELPLSAETVTMDASEPSVLYLGARNAGDVSFVLREYDESALISQGPVVEGEVLREWTEGFDTPPNQSELVPLYLRRLRGALPTGLYGLEWQLEGEDYGPRHLGIAVVDRHLSIKLTREEALVWVADLRSGSPITRTAVRLIDNQGLLIAGGTTDDQGLARIPVSPVDNLWDRVAAVTGNAGEPGFGIVMTQWFGEASPWNFGLNFAGGVSSRYRTYLETDRELYKPEQTVYFHGLIREDLDGTYGLPSAETQVDITLHNVELQPIYSKTLTLSAFGSFSGSVHLEEMVPLGDYVISAVISSNENDKNPNLLSPYIAGTKRIRVEKYRKPPFEVEVIPDSDDVRQGDTLHFEVRASYFSGEVVSGGSVNWVLSAEPHSSSDLVHVTESGWQWNGRGIQGSSKVITRGTGLLNESGMIALEFPADLVPLAGGEAVSSQRWTLKAVVTDESQLPVSEPVSAVGRAVIHQADMHLGLRLSSSIVRARERVEVEVRAVGWEGDLMPGRDVMAKLIRRTWSSDSADQQQEKAINESLISEVPLTTDDDGKALAAFNPPRSGNYVVRLEGEDARGNDVDAEAVLWVSGDDSFVWRPTSDAVTLKPNAETYEVGEVAEILVPVPFTTTYQLLLTVERGDLLRVDRFVFEQPNPVIELPIEDGYAPNVYVSILAMRPGQDEASPDARAGTINLPVNPTRHLLDVSIEADRDSYRPGDDARLVIQTLDYQGQPIDAEVSLSVVDKGMSGLQQTLEDRTIVEAFYGEHPLAVSSGHTLLVLVNRLAEQLRLSDGFVRDQAPVGQGGGAGTPSFFSEARQDFPDTAFWNPTLRTGDDGQAEVVVKLPDSLTTWVAHATAATQGTQVGVAESEIKVHQSLSVRPMVPEFLVVGDRTEIVAVVHNRTESDLDARVAIEAQGVSVEGNPIQEISVPANDRIPVVWALNASQDSPASAKLGLSVGAGQHRDSVRLDDIPIRRWVMPDVRGASGVLEGAGQTIETFYIPVSATNSSALKLSVDTSLASGLIGQIDGLSKPSGYQTTDALANRTLTALAALEAISVQTEVDEAIVEKAEATVTEALECIQLRQNPDGGWGWWRDWSNLHMTSYVAMTLIRADSAGFSVSDSVLDRALDYVEVMTTRALETDARYPHFALAIRVLSQAERPWPSGAATTLYRDREALGMAGRFHLAIALGAVDSSDPRVMTLLGDLRTEARISATGAHWEYVDSQHWTTDVQVTALAVEAMTLISPDDPLLPQAVRWLMNARSGSRWSTEYETAWANLSLATYLIQQDTRADTGDFGISINGRSLLDEGHPSTLEMEFDLRLGTELQQGLNVLSITRQSGEGRLYYASSLHLFQSINEIESESRGMRINRQYCQSSQQESQSELSSDLSCSPVGAAASGDVLEVRLTIMVPAKRHYVQLEDSFPAGFRPVPQSESDRKSALRPVYPVEEPSDASEEGATDSGVVGWLDAFEQREYHENRVRFYARELEPGTYQVRYLLRAVFPGTYHTLPAVASELYFPEVWGRTESAVLEVLPKE